MKFKKILSNGRNRLVLAIIVVSFLGLGITQLTLIPYDNVEWGQFKGTDFSTRTVNIAVLVHRSDVGEITYGELYIQTRDLSWGSDVKVMSVGNLGLTAYYDDYANQFSAPYSGEYKVTAKITSQDTNGVFHVDQFTAYFNVLASSGLSPPPNDPGTADADPTTTNVPPTASIVQPVTDLQLSYATRTSTTILGHIPAYKYIWKVPVVFTISDANGDISDIRISYRNTEISWDNPDDKYTVLVEYGNSDPAVSLDISDTISHTVTQIATDDDPVIEYNFLVQVWDSENYFETDYYTRTVTFLKEGGEDIDVEDGVVITDDDVNTAVYDELTPDPTFFTTPSSDYTFTIFFMIAIAIIYKNRRKAKNE